MRSCLLFSEVWYGLQALYYIFTYCFFIQKCDMNGYPLMQSGNWFELSKIPHTISIIESLEHNRPHPAPHKWGKDQTIKFILHMTYCAKGLQVHFLGWRISFLSMLSDLASKNYFYFSVQNLGGIVCCLTVRQPLKLWK